MATQGAQVAFTKTILSGWSYPHQAGDRGARVRIRLDGINSHGHQGLAKSETFGCCNFIWDTDCAHRQSDVQQQPPLGTNIMATIRSSGHNTISHSACPFFAQIAAGGQNPRILVCVFLVFVSASSICRQLLIAYIFRQAATVPAAVVFTFKLRDDRARPGRPLAQLPTWPATCHICDDGWERRAGVVRWQMAS